MQQVRLFQMSSSIFVHNVSWLEDSIEARTVPADVFKVNEKLYTLIFWRLLLAFLTG